MKHNMKYKYAVWQYNTHINEHQFICFFSDYSEAKKYIDRIWEDQYNNMLSEEHICRGNRIIPDVCWREDGYAQICYINIDDDETNLYKITWRIIRTSEPNDSLKSEVVNHEKIF